MLRAFGFGFAGILIAVHLQSRGFSPTEIGVALTIGLLAASLSGLLSAAASMRWGRRATLAVVGLLMALSGADLALAPRHWALILAGLTGMMGIAGADNGPFLAVEQAMLTEAATTATRNRAFARYSLIGALGAAAGAYTASLGTGLARTRVWGAAGGRGRG